MIDLDCGINNHSKIVASTFNVNGEVINLGVILTTADQSSIEVGVEASGGSDGQIGLAYAIGVEEALIDGGA